MSEDSSDHSEKPPGNVARLHPPRMPHHPALDRAVQGMIGAQLRSMYEHYVEQPIPDRLLELVGRLGSEGVAAAEAGHGLPPQAGVGTSREDLPDGMAAQAAVAASGEDLPDGMAGRGAPLPEGKG